MQKMLLKMALIFLPLGLMAQTKQYKLQVNMPAMADATQIHLIYVKDTTVYRDSALIKGGIANFTGPWDAPVQASVRTLTNGKVADRRSLYLEAGDNLIKGNDSLKYATIQHSLLNREDDTLQAAIEPLMQEIIAIRQQARAIPKDEKKSPKMDSLNAQYKRLVTAYIDIKKTFIKAHPDSYLSLITLKTVVGRPMNVAEIRPMFEALNPAIRKSAAGEAFQQSIKEAMLTTIGAIAPDIQSKDTLGNLVELKKLLSQSKYVLVDFWASWCGPCRAENPNVVKSFKQFQDKGFNILSVSLDEKAGPWKKAINKDGMPWLHASSLMGWKEPAAVSYNVSAIPANFLLDHEGRIVARGLRGEALSEKLEELMP